MTPENIIEQWADCFNNADMKGILSLYHDNATLLPTFLPKLLASNNEIKGYFEVAFNGGASYSPVSSCIVTFNNSNYSKEAISERERNYDLNTKNEPNTYNFSYENIGFFDSKELIKLGFDTLIEKLNEFKTKFDDYEFKNDFYFFMIKDENDTLGNLVTSYLMDNSNIEYSGYNIEHPLKNEIIIKIKINGKKEQLFKIINYNIDDIISMVSTLKKEIK